MPQVFRVFFHLTARWRGVVVWDSRTLLIIQIKMTMKLFLTTTIIATLFSPLAFADCKKCDSDKEKKEETVNIVADCKKCDGDKKEKKEDALLAGKCKKKDCDKDKDEDPALA